MRRDADATAARQARANGSGNDQPPPSYTLLQRLSLALGPILFVTTVLSFQPDGVSASAGVVLATTLWMATWWIGECVPLPVTALLPIMIFPLAGALETDEVFSAYGDNIVFLFMGGFFIALALEKWDLHKRIALGIVRAVGTSVQRIILGFIFATAFVSLWITNTATTMMMMPIGLAIITQLRTMAPQDVEKTDIESFEKAIIYGIGYAATIAGVGTLIGGTSIPVFIAQADAIMGVTISFAQYLLFGIPFVVTFLLILWLYLTKIKFRMKFRELPAGADIIASELEKLGRMSREQHLVTLTGLLVAFLWMFRSWIIDPFVADISDGMIAAFGAALLFTLPASQNKTRTRILVWEDSSKIPWGVLLLFGGGLALAAAYESSGLSEWIGSQFALLGSTPWLLVVIISAFVLVFLTEFTSTTATALLFIPLAGSGALAIGQDPLLLMLTTALAVNCAFMLPAATPPNAIMYSSGLITIRDLTRTGLALSLTGVILISAFIILWAPIVFAR